MWHEYVNVCRVEDALKYLSKHRERARIVAGATDLILELERNVRKDVDVLIDVTRIPQMDQIVLDEHGMIYIGALVSHNDCANSKLIQDHAFPLAQAAWEVGSPQIRNRGTVAGNVVTASPANDTITPLMALGARVTLRSEKNERIVALDEFYCGVRRTVLQPDEMLVNISFPALEDNQRGVFIKHALRRSQAISLINVAIVLTLSANSLALVEKAVITLGAVAPTIIHASAAEAYLTGKPLNDEHIGRAAEIAMGEARPISDIRSSANYRRRMVGVMVRRGLNFIEKGIEKDGFPQAPVLLGVKKYSNNPVLTETLTYNLQTPMTTTINGRQYTFNSGQNKTLLHLIREEANLTGSKEGCSEGECGACTVFLDGMAVMSCLVPAPRAHGAEIVTIEGLAQNGKLHPVQEAFVEEGAVQCGYCTPGFIMSATKLLEERPKPSEEEIKQAIAGNLCRCTGYYKIIQAIETAAEKGV